MNPIYVQVVAPGVTHFFHCMHCEQIFDQVGIGEKLRREEYERYPEEFKQEAMRLAGWLTELAQKLGKRVHFEVIDPQSFFGLWLSIRYGIRKYPTFIVQKKHRVSGWDEQALLKAIEEHLE